jgi:hypothetical protein
VLVEPVERLKVSITPAFELLATGMVIVIGVVVPFAIEYT